MGERAGGGGGGGGEGEEEKRERRTSAESGHKPIDSRIEQALDLVKSHLRNSVRSELEELMDKVKILEDTVTIISQENEFLKGNVKPEVLSQLALSEPLQNPTSGGSGRSNGCNGSNGSSGSSNGTISPEN